MRRAAAWLAVAASAACTVASLLGPWWVPAAVALAAVALGRGRRGLLWMLALSMLFNAAFMAVLVHQGHTWWSWGPLAVTTGGMQRAAVASLRLTALLGVPALLGALVAPSVLVDGLGLPPRATSRIAAVWIAAHELASDWQRLERAASALGHRRSARRMVSLFPVIAARAVARGKDRRDALHLAGLPVHDATALMLAFAGLAAAGRLAMAGIPNVAPTYLIVFVAGWHGGWRVGAGAGAVAMLVTDLLLSGIAPVGLVNVPAMAAVGASGAVVSRLAAGRAGAWWLPPVLAATGVAVTMLFSVLADSAEWAMVPEFHQTTGWWSARVLAGLVFNVPAALVNGAAFAVAVLPAAHALDAVRSAGSHAARPRAPAPA